MLHRIYKWLELISGGESVDKAREELAREREQTQDLLEDTKTQIRLNKAIQGLQESAKREPHAR